MPSITNELKVCSKKRRKRNRETNTRIYQKKVLISLAKVFAKSIAGAVKSAFQADGVRKQLFYFLHSANLEKRKHKKLGTYSKVQKDFLTGATPGEIAKPETFSRATGFMASYS